MTNRSPIEDDRVNRSEHSAPAGEPRDGVEDLPWRVYRRACELVEEGNSGRAKRLYSKLEKTARPMSARIRGLIQNDLAALAAVEGKLDEARRAWERALALDEGCLTARLNRDLFEAELSLADVVAGSEDLKIARPPAGVESMLPDSTGSAPRGTKFAADAPARVAIVSFLFNWPSTGGGNMHTAGLAEFLGRAGYEVRHFYARYPAWGIGRVAEELPFASQGVEFRESDWDVATIQTRFRRAINDFEPDFVVVTDCWNMKPHLAEAARGYPRLLLFQAQECLCPLNNLRLFGVGPARVEQCPRNQLATPETCRGCLAERGRHSGALHQAERALAGVGGPEYDRKLRESLREAEAVLALNPLIAAMLEPYAGKVWVVPWGIDAERFPAAASAPMAGSRPARLFMAAVAGEFIKGFHVAHEACRLLRRTRDDFELVVTFDPPGRIDEFTRSVGWCSQAELPARYREADLCLVPTIAQDGLSITSVEAMAAGRPVVASRIGGLPYTVGDGATGLLCEPGDPVDLARQIARLLDDPPLRERMGRAGRTRFEADFTWEVVIDRYWRPLLAWPAARPSPGVSIAPN